MSLRRRIALALALFWVIAAAVVTCTDRIGPTYLESAKP